MATKHYFSNSDIASLLRDVAASLQVDSSPNQFRIAAYQRAADAIEHSGSDIKDLWDNHQLSQIAGIGESIASYLDELFTTGQVKHFSQIIARQPPAFYELLKLSGVGPQTSLKLCQGLGLSKKSSCISRLQKAASHGHIQTLPGFGPQSESQILDSIRTYKGAVSRLLIHIATRISQDLLSYLSTCPSVIAAHPLGSLRRQCPTIGDIDIAVSSNHPDQVISHFIAYPKKIRVLDSGDHKASLLLSDQIRVDLMVSPPDSFGSLLQHLTGSKHHNIALREYAQTLGYSLSEYGLKPIKNQTQTRVQHTFSDEKSLYNFLKLDPIPPELREDAGEISAAKSHQLPQLVELVDIRGDLHTHSSFDTQTSHDLGQHSPMQMLQTAKSLGYQYLGLSEHNPGQSNHSPSQVISLLSRKRQLVSDLNSQQSEIYLFNSLEIDILASGQLAIPDPALDLLDYAIVSVHSSFRQSKKQTTDRIISGLSHPKAKILGHPTGRLLLEREGIEIDWDRLFDFCVKHHKWLEIDAWPNRLDLPDTLIRQAVSYGLKLIISTDSHSLDHLSFMNFGISQARRGWAQKSDIINTLDLNSLKEVINSL